MEKLERKTKQIVVALKSLQTVIHKFSERPRDDEDFAEIRDSVIKRFEYSIDTFWKFLKEYIEVKHGILPPASPKGVFKSAAEIKVISKAEEIELQILIEDRNRTSHAYHVEVAESIVEVVNEHHQVVQKIVDRLII